MSGSQYQYIGSMFKDKVEFVKNHFEQLTDKDYPNFNQASTDAIYKKLIDFKYQIIRIMEDPDFPSQERSYYQSLLDEYNIVINNLGQYVSFQVSNGGKKRKVLGGEERVEDINYFYFTNKNIK